MDIKVSADNIEVYIIQMNDGQRRGGGNLLYIIHQTFISNLVSKLVGNMENWKET